MSRINTNIAALNTLRNLQRTQKDMNQTLERLSSGQRINRAADGPAELVISEKMRAQVSSIDQAINNSETSVSMVQTAEGALNEVSAVLIELRQLAVHAANAGGNDPGMLQADQSQIENLLDTLERVANNTQFGTRNLLDGSNSADGVAVGDGLEFIEAGVNTQPSPSEGYKVNVTQVATRSMAVATRSLNIEDAMASYVLKEGGHTAVFDPKTNTKLKGQIERVLNAVARPVEPLDELEARRTIQQLVASELQRLADQEGLDLEIFVYRPPEDTGDISSDYDEGTEVLNEIARAPGHLNQETAEELLVIRHRDFGSEPTFSVTTSIEGFFDEEAASNQSITALPGKDIEGTIGGNPEVDDGWVAIGEGQFLTGAPGTDVDGLLVQYTRDTDDVTYEIFNREQKSVRAWLIEENDNEALVGNAKPEASFFNNIIPEVEGFVHVTQNSLAFQVGPNQGQQVKISLPSIRPEKLSMDVVNESKFKNLSEISVLESADAQSTIQIVDAAIEEVADLRAKLGAFQKNALESNLNSLRISKENLTSAESELRDTDMAAEMSEFVRNQILVSSGTAMLAQANQAPRSVLQLLSGANG